jgi:hypothetical protein
MILPWGFTLHNLFNLPQELMNAELYGLVFGLKAGKRIQSNLGGQFATLGANVSAFIY